MKYHVNPTNGNPYPCKAVTKCPYGGDDVHYLTAPAARAAYEMRMHDEARAALAGLQAKRIEEAIKVAAKPAPQRRPFLTPEQAAAINVDGIRCPHCRAQLTPSQASEALDQVSVHCSECDGWFDLYDMIIEVGPTKDTYQAYDAGQVSKMTWYHATTADDWESYFKAGGGDGFVAHLGSFQAAMDRRIAEDYISYKTSDGFWLHEVKVSAEATIDDEVKPDSNEDYDSPSTPMNTDVVRYVNKYEDMASISLAAKTDSLNLVRRRWVTFEEAIETPSLYNVSNTSSPAKPGTA